MTNKAVSHCYKVMSDAIQEWYSSPRPLPDAAPPINPHPEQTPVPPPVINPPTPPLTSPPISHPRPSSTPYRHSQPVASSIAESVESNLSHHRDQPPPVTAPSIFASRSSPVLSIAGRNKRPTSSTFSRAQSISTSSSSGALAGKSSDNNLPWSPFKNLSISDITSTSAVSESVADQRAVAYYVRDIGSVVGIVYEGSSKDAPLQYEYPSKLGPKINEYYADHGYTQSAVLAIDRIYEQSQQLRPDGDYFVSVLASKNMEVGVARYIWKLAREYEGF